jgi:hypothetical protein
MKFTPKSEADIQAEADKRGAWPPGIYDAEIVTAVDGVSKAGNDMITLTLSVFEPDTGAPRTMFDWLVEAMAFKVRHCADAAGLTAEYEKGELLAWQLEAKAVKVKLGIDNFTREDGTAGKRNKVLDYVVSRDPQPRAVAPARAAPTPKKDFDDDIPF